MRRVRGLVLLGTALVIPAGPTAGQGTPHGPPEERVADLAHLFDDVEQATAVILDGDRWQVTRFRPERASVRVRPASTFKIPHTLIALETGVVHGPDFQLAWDSVRDPRSGFFPDSWARDQTLRSAFRNSVYWYYQELARRIGRQRMTAWLRRFDYGNASTAGGLDRFWLTGGLGVSPDEQVLFLHRLLTGRLAVSDATLSVLRDVALLHDGAGWRLYGKTGTSAVTSTRENGWIVGWLERRDGVVYYAVNMEGEHVWEAWPPGRRVELALEVLREVGSLDGAGALTPPRTSARELASRPGDGQDPVHCFQRGQRCGRLHIALHRVSPHERHGAATAQVPRHAQHADQDVLPFEGLHR